MTTHCAFCSGALKEEQEEEGTGNDYDENAMGGVFRSTAWTCTRCGYRLLHQVTVKLGMISESWKLDEDSPVERIAFGAAEHGGWACPSCGGALCSVKPPEAEFDNQQPRRVRTVEFSCSGCRRPLLRTETEDAGNSSSIWRWLQPCDPDDPRFGLAWVEVDVPLR